jgi:ATP-binding cassette subfamily B protein
VVAIVLLHPALLPLLIIGGVPVLITSRRQSQLEFDFLARQSESTRMRNYLTWVQTGRDEAKEVRAFGLARNFGTRLNLLYTEYLRDLAQHLWHRSRLGAIGSFGSAVLLALTLLVLVWLIFIGRLSISEAAAALVAIRILAGQVHSGFTGVKRSSNRVRSSMIWTVSSPWHRRRRAAPARSHRRRSFIASGPMR